MSAEERLKKFKPRPFWVRYCIHYIAMFLGSIFTKTRVIGKHYLPEKGPYIIAANHFNVFDPPLVIYAIQKPISFLAASDTVFTFVENLALWLYGFIPTNRSNLSPSTIKMSKRVLKNRGLLGIFPEGDTEGEELRQPKAGVVYLSASHMTQIVPVGIYGLKKSLWSYLLDGVRPQITVKIGKPFGPYTLSKDRKKKEDDLIQIGNEVMCRIAALIPDKTHGVFSNDPKINQYKKENES